MSDRVSTDLKGAAYLNHEVGSGCERSGPSAEELYLDQKEIDMWWRERPRRYVVHDGYRWEAAPEPLEDPMFDILRAARADEEAARDTYGDRAVDRAITRLLNEPGLNL